ncbi:LacI family DNA-binding transcriptional regulator [Blastomonas sp. CACIA14H2]|uniref:LacI family DNA-binding transcriptional regulator n=1 Tax=Blastomonas sp. CACIA14H2 TaxID=1419876 RepID=UPI004058EB71
MKKPQSTAANMAGRRPTSYDVARLAGVSQSAVSRCFRPGNSISAEKRKRILKAAAQLGYQPNAIASGLITKRSNLVAVLISSLTNLYYPQVLAELTQRLDAQGIRVLLFALQAESDVGTALEHVWRYRVDGAIAAARLSSAQLQLFERHHVPVVLYNRHSEGESVPSVCCDSIGGERLLVDRLVEAGHRDFAIISGPDDSYVSNERVEGARARLEHHGLIAHIIPGQFDHDSGAAGARALLTADRRPDAIICANDLMAIGAIDTARDEFGLDIPADISIVGFDGVEPAAWPSYRLTTIRQPVRRMTDAAVTMLLERIENPALPPEVRSFTGALIKGHSARLG